MAASLSRKRVKVTGSSLFTAIGGDGLKRLKDHFDKAEKDPTLEQKKAMEHGVVNEINEDDDTCPRWCFDICDRDLGRTGDTFLDLLYLTHVLSYFNLH
ncbi:hypothetical protein DPMN_172974 [Dreissena polymorpha]|uniref:Uncharacterized protein n=1 Tax=Dreissena polymorpha TaxID=45954 RepID=A0A9D4IH48_DREPO|nr:hypothetical protein DPMN_172974 [Dreissena polymorpha]